MKPLKQYSLKELNALEANARMWIASNDEKKVLAGHARLNEIASERMRRGSKVSVFKHGLLWDDSNRTHRVGTRDGVVVAEIWQDENHTADNYEVYSVVIRGQRHSKRFRFIEDARAEIGRVLAEQN